MFIGLIKTVFVFAFVNQCARCNFCIDLSGKFAYYCLYAYSVSEEMFNKHIHPIFIYDDILRNNLELILDKNGDNYITDTEELAIDKNIPTEYKFAIYTRLTNDNTVRKYRIYKKLPEVYDCDETIYKFILIEFVFGDKTYKIALSTAKSTYYVVNNEFDATVFRHILRTDHGIQLPEQYKVNILDQNVSKIELNETQVLKFNKDNYEVKTI